jgi:hypothetical protein
VEKSIIAKGLNEMNLAEGVMAMTCWIFFYLFWLYGNHSQTF